MPKVIDIKSKKPFKRTKLCDEHQTEWVITELCKIINKAEKKKFNALSISVGLTEVTVNYVHDTAPDVLSAQHLLTTTINLELERQLKERLEDRDA